MARLPVEQVTCDRCKRKELQPPAPPGPRAPLFEASLGEKRISYADLCGRCEKALGNLWEYIAEWQRELKQAHVSALPDESLAPPLELAADYTPPKPHSAAANGRK